MGIKNETFGSFGRTQFGQGSQPAKDRKDAEYWMNVGYPAEVPGENEGETETVFVSLPFGIPLDTQEHFDLSKIRNPGMVELRDSQNQLLDQIMEVANSLEPGEEKLVAVDGKTGLCVQIRRVKQAAAAPADGENKLVKKLKLVA